MLNMLRSDCSLAMQLNMYSYSEIYQDLGEVRLEIWKNLTYYSLDTLQSQANYKDIRDKLPIVEDCVKCQVEGYVNSLKC